MERKNVATLVYLFTNLEGQWFRVSREQRPKSRVERFPLPVSSQRSFSTLPQETVYVSIPAAHSFFRGVRESVNKTHVVRSRPIRRFRKHRVKCNPIIESELPSNRRVGCILIGTFDRSSNDRQGISVRIWTGTSRDRSLQIGEKNTTRFYCVPKRMKISLNFLDFLDLRNTSV